MPSDERRQLVVAGAGVAHDAPDRRHVVATRRHGRARRSAAFGHRRHERSGSLQQRRRETRRARRTGAVGQHARRVDRRRRLVDGRASGRPRRSSRARSRADRSSSGSRRRSGSPGAAPSARAPSARRRGCLRRSPQRRHVRRRVGRRRAEDVVQDPLAAQHRRRPVRTRRHVRMLPCPSSPRRSRRSA